jgi:hypothetical protein
VKLIFRYIKGTPYFRVWYAKGNELNMFTYTDADLAGSIDEKRSTSGAYFYLED